MSENTMTDEQKETFSEIMDCARQLEQLVKRAGWSAMFYADTPAGVKGGHSGRTVTLLGMCQMAYLEIMDCARKPADKDSPDE